MKANIGASDGRPPIARWFLTGLDGWAMIWIVFGGTGIAMAVQAMSFLEPESEDG
jgi:hypothetical protein